MKTADFGQPCRAPEPGKCRICGCSGGGPPPYTFEQASSAAFVCVVGDPPNRRYCGWADETRTLCDNPKCVDAARAELNLDPIEAEVLRRPYEGKRYGFAPGRRR